MTAIKDISNALEKIHGILSFIDDRLNHKIPMTIEQLLEKISPIIDEEIINHAKDKNLTPIGGEIKLNMQTDNNILASWEFYFSDNHKNISKIGSKNTISQNSLTTDAILQVQSHDLIFNINLPINLIKVHF